MSIIFQNKVLFAKKIILCLLIPWISLKGQNPNLDSLIKLSNGALHDSAKARICLNIYKITRNSNLQIAKEFIYKCNKILRDNKSLSRDYFFHSLIECSSANRLLGDFKEATKYIGEAHKIADSLNNSKMLAEVYNEQGLLQINIGDFPSARKCFLRVIGIKNLLNPNDSTLYGDYNNLAISYAQTGDLPIAEKYFRSALQTAVKQNNISAIGNGFNNVGVIKIMQGELDSVLHYLYKGLTCRKKINELHSIAGSYNNLALYFRELKKRDIALKYADTSFKIATEIKGKSELLEVLDTYYHLYEDMGDYRKALSYYKEKQNYLKQIQDEKIEKQLAEYQAGLDLSKKQEELNESKNQLLLKEAKESQQRLKINLMLLALLTVVVAIVLVVNRNKKISAANKIISLQKEQVESQKLIIEEKHKDITDSINYAKKIQTALIISEKNLSTRVDNAFVIFKPRDIVSGDFYWYGENSGFKILVVADCTGHGVPGALMSMIGITLLNQIVIEKGIVSPSEILNKLREGVITSLNLSGNATDERDGMDVSLIAWNKDELWFAGANNPCLVVINNEVMELKPDKQPVGLHEQQKDFTQQCIKTGNINGIYLFTDGIVDQFGGQEGKKLKIKNFKHWINECSEYSASEQKKKLSEKFDNWKNQNEQTDDVLLIGLKNEI